MKLEHFPIFSLVICSAMMPYVLEMTVVDEYRIRMKVRRDYKQKERAARDPDKKLKIFREFSPEVIFRKYSYLMEYFRPVPDQCICHVTIVCCLWEHMVRHGS